LDRRGPNLCRKEDSTGKKNKRPQEKLRKASIGLTVSSPEKPELPEPRVNKFNTKKQRFMRLLTVWKKHFPVGNGLPGSWLHAVKTRAGHELTCKACAFAKTNIGNACQEAKVLEARKCRLVRHSHTAFHKRALVAYRQHMWANDSEAQRLIAVSGAPSTEELSALWRALKATAATSTQTEQSQRRTASMEWCLYEAIRDQEREFMSKAQTISVALDERKGRLLVTYRACKGVVVRAGVLAQLQHLGY